MNNLLELNGKFNSRKNQSSPSTPTLSNHQSISSQKLRSIAANLQNVHKFWTKQNILSKELIAVHQTRVIPKSKRLRKLLSDKGLSCDDEIVGAHFEETATANGTTDKRHVFIYYVSKEAAEKSIGMLFTAADIIDRYYDGAITYKDTGIKRKIAGETIIPKPYSADKLMKKTCFLQLVVDCSSIDHLDIPRKNIKKTNNNIIRIYKTDGSIQEILEKYGIFISPTSTIDDTTAKLTDQELSMLTEKAPYLIAMSVGDMSQYPVLQSTEVPSSDSAIIRDPKNEPVIGVIDQLFDTNCYFSKWVEYHEMIDPNLPISEKDYLHGTYVTSIIVDGPRANPDLDDGCGNFRVRHFGVCIGKQFSSFSVLKKIQKIVEENQDIKVWNLSIGSNFEIDENSISPIAAELDRLQEKYNIVFVVAGTNKPEKISPEQDYRIGSPADSINSIVVNSVDIHNNPASYTRRGPVLSFYNKPDVCCFGGDGSKADEKMKMYDPISGMCHYDSGTSFAAPWISRKMAYLIQVIGLSRECAKALLIDSACGWNNTCDLKKGYGVVPIRIEDILNAHDDEIRFIIKGTSISYETYNFNIPVPIANDKFPYYARATLVYYPSCNVNQGVDYTGTELDIHFGRIDDSQKIKDIKNNTQADEGIHINYEEDARQYFRKWDNVKYIADKVSEEKCYPRKAYENNMWGIRIVRKERSDTIERKPLRFGIVITLKEMFGVNRYDDFIRACSLRNWIVNEIDIDNRVNIYEKAEQDIHFE